MPPATRITTTVSQMRRLMSLFGRYRGGTYLAGSPLAAPYGPIEVRQGDAVIRERLRFGVLGLGQGELRVRELEDRADAGVEAALSEPEVLLRGLDGFLRGPNPLVRLVHGDDGLLDVLRDREVLRFDARLGRLEVGAGLAISGDAIAAVEDRPRQRQRGGPRLVERGADAAVRGRACDVGEEVPEGALELRVSRLGGEARLARFGAPFQRLVEERRAVERRGLIDEIVEDLRRQARGDAHRRVQRDASEPLGVTRADDIDARVGHIDFGAGHVRFRTGPHFEESA